MQPSLGGTCSHVWCAPTRLNCLGVGCKNTAEVLNCGVDKCGCTMAAADLTLFLCMFCAAESVAWRARNADSSEATPARIWDLEAKSCKVLKGHIGQVHGVAMNADGAVCVSGGEDSTV
eukprot:scaffold44440_cov19-Tisochrysis_lutea.AAC.4